MVYPDPFGDGAYYGDEQAMATGMRSSYGDSALTGMAGLGAFGGGAYQGVNNMFGQIGARIRPVTYTPPARINTGYYGQYVQETGFFRGLTGMFGLNDPPVAGMTAYEHGMNEASDFGRRIAASASSLAVYGGAIAAGYQMSGLGAAAGGFVGSSLGPMGMKVGAGLGSFFAPMIATQLADQVLRQVSERNEISNFLEASSFRYIGAGSSMADPRKQSGMGYKARLAATDVMRKLELSDPTMGHDDMQQLLQESTRLGLFTGVQGIDDFEKKMKSINENVKIVSKFLHTTLKDGLETMKQLKGMGLDVSETGSYAVQASALGRLAGRTGMEMMTAGLQGAELFRGTGVDMRIGYQSNIMNLAQIRAARDAGFLSQETISQAGGEEALAQRRTASSLQYAQTASGRGFNAAFFNPSSGGFDASAFAGALKNNDSSFSDLVLQASRNLGSPKDVLTYQANQEKMLSEMGNTYGGMGLQLGRMAQIKMTAEYMSKMTGAPIDVTYRAIAKRQFGMSEAEVDADMADLKDPVAAAKRKQAALNADRTAAQLERAYRNNIFTYGYNKVTDFVRSGFDAVARPINEVQEEVGVAFRDFKDENIYGIERARAGASVDVTGVIRREEVQTYKEQLHDFNVDLSKGVFTNQAENLMKARNMGLVDFQVEDAYGSFDELQRNPNIKGRAYLGGKRSARREEVERSERRLERLGNLSEKRYEDLKKNMSAVHLPSMAVFDLSEKMRKDDKVGIDAILLKYTGKNLDTATEEDIALARKSVEESGSNILKERFERDLQFAREYSSSNQTSDVQQAKTLEQSIASRVARVNLSQEGGMSYRMAEDELTILAMADRETDPKKKEELLAKAKLLVSNRLKGKNEIVTGAGGVQTFVTPSELVDRVMASDAFKREKEGLLGDNYKKDRQLIEIGKRTAGEEGQRTVAAMTKALDQGAAKSVESLQKIEAFKTLPTEKLNEIVNLSGQNKLSEAKAVAGEAYYKNFSPTGEMVSTPNMPGSSPGQSGGQEIRTLETQMRINQEVLAILQTLSQRMVAKK